MFLVVGLGNPGEKYENTRHNVGFAVVDAFAKKHGFPEFSLEKKANTLVSTGLLGEQQVALAKPQTFMNNSGEAVKFLTTFYSLHTAYLIVVHDDIDLPFGAIRISRDKGTAGHKGVESVAQHLKTLDFLRVRVGIQPQEGKPQNTETFVLKKFMPEEQTLLEKAIAQAVSALEVLLSQGQERAMNEFNK